jgi:hypothetical protein
VAPEVPVAQAPEVPNVAPKGAPANQGASAEPVGGGTKGKSGGTKGGGGEGGAQSLFWAGLGALEGWLRGKAVQREVQKKGFVPVGPGAFKDDSLIDKISRAFQDPTLESQANPMDRFDVKIWRDQVRAAVAGLPPEQTTFVMLINMVWQDKPDPEERYLPHRFSMNNVDDVPVTFDRGADGSWQPRVPEGGRIEHGGVRFGQNGVLVPDLNRILDPSVPDADVMEMLFPGYKAAQWEKGQKLLHGEDYHRGESA